MKYTHDEYFDILFTLVPVIVDLVTLHRISHRLILVDVWHGA